MLNQLTWHTFLSPLSVKQGHQLLFSTSPQNNQIITIQKHDQQLNITHDLPFALLILLDTCYKQLNTTSDYSEYAQLPP